MRHEVIMPALGMNQDNGVIAAWHKKIGDKVCVGDILMDVETDKAIMEIEAQHDGFIDEIIFSAQQEVPIGNAVAYISSDKPSTDFDSQQPLMAINQTAKDKVEIKDNVVELSQVKSHEVHDDTVKTLASPKAKQLVQSYQISIEQVANYCKKPLIHAADVINYQDNGNKQINLQSNHGIANQPALCFTFEVSSQEFNSCCQWLEKELGMGGKQGMLLASLTATLVRKLSLVDDDKSLVAKVEAWDGKCMQSLTLTNPESQRFSQITADEPAQQDWDFHIIYLGDCAIKHIELNACAKPTLLISQNDELLHGKFHGYEYSQLPLAIQLVDGLAKAIELPLLHIT